MLFLEDTPILALKISYRRVGMYLGPPLYGYALNCHLVYLAIPGTWSECVKVNMKICNLDSINPLNREAWGLGVRHSSHMLPTPVPGTPEAKEKETQDQVKVKGHVCYA